MALFKPCIVWDCWMCVSMSVLYTSIYPLQPLYRCTHHSCEKYDTHSRISRTDLLLVSSHRTIVREATKLTGDELWVLCVPKKCKEGGEWGRRDGGLIKLSLIENVAFLVLKTFLWWYCSCRMWCIVLQVLVEVFFWVTVESGTKHVTVKYTHIYILSFNVG